MKITSRKHVYPFILEYPVRQGVTNNPIKSNNIRRL